MLSSSEKTRRVSSKLNPLIPRNSTKPMNALISKKDLWSALNLTSLHKLTVTR